MSVKDSYVHTLHACNVSYVTQAIVNGFAPLLFLWFHDAYGLERADLWPVILGNFWIQMCVAFACAKLADRISCRLTLVIGQFCSAAGLALLTVLPELFPWPLAGLTCAVVFWTTCEITGCFCWVLAGWGVGWGVTSGVAVGVGVGSGSG